MLYSVNPSGFSLVNLCGFSQKNACVIFLVNMIEIFRVINVTSHDQQHETLISFRFQEDVHLFAVSSVKDVLYTQIELI